MGTLRHRHCPSEGWCSRPFQSRLTGALRRGGRADDCSGVPKHHSNRANSYPGATDTIEKTALRFSTYLLNQKSRPQTTFLRFPSRRPQTAKHQGAGSDVKDGAKRRREGENFSRLPQGKKFRPPCLSLTGGTRDKLVRCGRGHFPGRPSPRSDTRESGGSKGVEGQCPSGPPWSPPQRRNPPPPAGVAAAAAKSPIKTKKTAPRFSTDQIKSKKVARRRLLSFSLPLSSPTSVSNLSQPDSSIPASNA